MRNSGPARAFVPIGIVLIVFGGIMLGIPSDSGSNRFEAILFIIAGAVAIAYGVYKTIKAFKKSRTLDENVPENGAFPVVDFSRFKDDPNVAEYYFRFDGNSLKPGYLIEDAERNLLFEGKMLKNSLVGARSFEFRDHTTGSVESHEVGHTTTTTYNNEFFSVHSWFKFDGENVWDVLHRRGLRMATDLHSKLPYLTYNVTKDGASFARIETSSIYVHEDDEAQHKFVIPVGKMYYRVWTATRDFDLLFLAIFAISETEQTIVE